jgi:hypothetical protein
MNMSLDEGTASTMFVGNGQERLQRASGGINHTEYFEIRVKLRTNLLDYCTWPATFSAFVLHVQLPRWTEETEEYCIGGEPHTLSKTPALVLR